jgi:hypothetical protein
MDVVVPGGEGAGEVQVLEYDGSDAGEPVPAWVGRSATELEGEPEFEGEYVFLFAFEDETLPALQSAMRAFPVTRAVSGVVLDRALRKTEGVRGVSDDLLERATRIVAAVEYAGLEQSGEFWVHEQIVTEEEKLPRYRGWLLYRVPEDQVMAALMLAYENASAAFPVRTDRDRAAREQLLERFRDGL